MNISEQVYKTLEENGPMTALEVANKLDHIKVGSVRSAIAHLQNSGFIRNAGSVKIGNRKHTLYDSTGPIRFNRMNGIVWTETTRRCSQCGEFKTFDEFYANNKSRRGINNVCKVCSGPSYGEGSLPVAEIRNYMRSAEHTEAISIEEGPLDTPCHLWQRAKTSGGYGQKGLNYKLTRVHRLALVTKLGRHIHPFMTASHLCHNRSCCNPEHMVEESLQDNIARSRRDPHANRAGRRSAA